MSTSCDPSLEKSIFICAAGSVVQEDSVQAREVCNLCLIPLILESLLIIGSSFHHLANPELCHSAWRGSCRVGKWGSRKGPSGVNRTHTHTPSPYVFIQVNKKKRDQKNREETKKKKRFFPEKSMLLHRNSCLLSNLRVQQNHQITRVKNSYSIYQVE